MKIAPLSGLKSWLDACLGFLYPEVCHYCGQERASAPEGYVGSRCRQQAAFIKPPYCQRCGLPFEGELTTPFACANCQDQRLYFTSARSAVLARGMVLDLLHGYKYHRKLWLEPFLAQLLVDTAREPLSREQWDVIVPVPLHLVKRREREFNQAERLARWLSQATDLPLETRVLTRLLPTDSQTQLSRQARARNVQKAFGIRDAKPVRGRRVVLVDDVFTTGATTNACARALLQARARRVCVWTVARGLWH